MFWGIEHLTNTIEHQAKDYIDKIDDMGGAPAAIEKGYIQKEIHDAAYSFQKLVDENKRAVVGVNRFTIEEEQKFAYLRVNPAAEEEQRKQLVDIRSRRDETKVQESLEVLRTGAEGTDNLVPLILDAVKAYSTLGEICGVMREVFGEYKAADL